MGDLRESLDAAIDELNMGEAMEETPQEVLADAPADNADEAVEALEGDAVSDAPPVDDDQKPKSAEAAGGVSDPNEGEGEGKNQTDSLKAPVDWTPQEREQWSKVPRSLQERIINREKQMSESMAGTGEARKLQNHFQQLTNSYAPVLAAEGVQDPMVAVESLFNTVAMLRMGTPEQKASEMARIIGEYGIDIAALDNALVGQPVADPQTSQLEQLLEQKLAPVQQFMQGMQGYQQQQQNQQQEQANQSVMQFAEQAEFLNDVRNDMADMIEIAAKRGVELSLEDAYKRACAVHPEISQILMEREKNARLQGQQQTLQQKMNASSSLHGRQVGTGGAGTGGTISLRDSIATAWDEAAG